jgi:hypothetical protein
MNENVRYNIDETFRINIEQMALQTPLPNLDGVRANILQKNLQSSQFQNRWLKGSLAIMAFLLGGCIFFLLKKPDEHYQNLTTEKKLKVYQTDTIYITRLQTKYLKVPLFIYPKSLTNKENNNHNPQTLADDQTFTVGLPIHKKQVTKENLTVSESPTYLALSRTRNLKTINTPELERTINTPNNIKSIVESLSLQNSNAEIENAADVLENPIPEPLSYESLKSKPYQSDIFWKKPFLKFKSPVKPTIKPQKITIPFVDRLMLGVYISPENNTVDIRNDAIQAFGLGDEEISSSTTLGLRVGFKVREKLSIISGVEVQNINFVHQNMGKEVVTAESGIDGNPIFLRHTVFGTVQLPTSEMTANPRVGSSVFVEGDKGHFSEFIRIPLSLKYQFYERSIRGFGWRGAGLSFYAIGGGFYAIPSKQQLLLEVYEPDTHDFYVTLNNFSNINPYTGLNLGLGAAFSFGRNFQCFVEPYYQTTMKSLINNMPIRTYVNGIGLKFGVNYQFSKR